MPFTLAEYKKQSQDEFRSSVIQTFIDNSPFLERLHFQNILGGSVTFNREKTLPTGVGFRALNADYTPSVGEIEQITESLKIVGGRVNVDRALLAQYGSERLGTDIFMQVKGLARALNQTVFKGDGTNDSFTGLQSRITTPEIIVNGDAALSVSALREAVLELEGDNTAMFMSKAMYSHIWAAYNEGTIQNITYSSNEFGKPVLSFGGIPLYQAGKDGLGGEILPFSETASTTSIYAVSFDPSDGVVGIQNSPLKTISMKEISVLSATDIEWLMNFMIQKPKSAIRISGITDASVVK